MKQRWPIALSVVAVVAAIVLWRTWFNKVWWADRIFHKWDIESSFASNKELLFNTSLARMRQIHAKGMDGWRLRGTSGSMAIEGQEPPAA